MSYSANISKRLADFSHSAYGSFQPNGIKGQCVWYVRGRAKEKVNADTGIYGNANTWFSSAVKKGLKTGQAPASDSICCLNRGKFGHVIYIEYVDGSTVYYTEANSNGDNRISSDDGILKRCTVSELTGREGYAGCIYLASAPTSNEGGFEVAKVWKNGSTKEKVYAETSLRTHIGTLDPHEVCDCLATVNGRYLVKYRINGTNDCKTGFVKYAGGVR